MSQDELVALAYAAARIAHKRRPAPANLGVEFEDLVRRAWRGGERRLAKQPTIDREALLSLMAIHARAECNAALLKKENHSHQQFADKDDFEGEYVVTRDTEPKIQERAVRGPGFVWAATRAARADQVWDARVLAALVYLEGWAVEEVAALFGLSVNSVKTKMGGLFRRIRPRLPRSRGFEMKTPAHARLKAGDAVTINTPDIPRLNGTRGTVIRLADWGAFLAAPAAASGEFRADWSEMTPLEDEAVVAKVKGYTGDWCCECQGFRMVRSGTCLRCDDCGATSGCS